MKPTAAAKTPSTQLFGVLYITLAGLVDFVVPNSRPCSILGQSVSYIIKLAPILWWALPAGSTAPHPKPPNASTFDQLPDRYVNDFLLDFLVLGVCFPPEAGVALTCDWEFAFSIPLVNYLQLYHKQRRAWLQVVLVLLASHKDLDWASSVYQPNDPPSS
ncbi:hypothetical protein DSO57_1018483 [Entomophthora muscae]|uniref:Uncharacterized protein n=1 Tax=Entomophthora muscae TaxID=34485 RepID=A0ACC2RVD5_9FUNG|nr:hypothetical protein DSO57_1018483 [Entomophthora muscae]